MDDIYPIEKVPISYFPRLTEIPDPPKELFMRGTVEKLQNTIPIAIVGSRACTPYGKEVCELLVSGLAGFPITIVSGLALGIDSIAHRAALAHNIPTIAFPGSGLDADKLYPAQHRELARAILDAGGALLSEFPPSHRATPWSFPMRNRLIAGMTHLTIVIEGTEKSGSLITARLANEYGASVGAVPGPVTSTHSSGPHKLLHLGAVPITSTADILEELGISTTTTQNTELLLSKDEQQLLALLAKGPQTKEDIIAHLSFSAVQTSVTCSMLELKGLVRETLGRIETTARRIC